MKFTVQGSTPFSAHICQYLYDLESNFAKEKLSLPLSQIIAHILYGTKRIRLGNEVIPSEVYTILEECIESNRPIPVSCIFGHEESEKDYIDIAEFQSLQTLKDISRRVSKFYSPGLNIRLDVIGDPKYVSRVTRLATIIGGFTIGTHQNSISVSFAHYRPAHYYYKSIPSRNIIRGGYVPAWDGKGYLYLESPNDIVSMITTVDNPDILSTTVVLEANEETVDLRVDYLIP